MLQQEDLVYWTKLTPVGLVWETHLCGITRVSTLIDVLSTDMCNGLHSTKLYRYLDGVLVC